MGDGLPRCGRGMERGEVPQVRVTITLVNEPITLVNEHDETSTTLTATGVSANYDEANVACARLMRRAIQAHWGWDRYEDTNADQQE